LKKDAKEKAPKERRWLRAVAAILLCGIGFLLARAPLFRETTVMVDAGGCRLVTDVVDAGEDEAQGYVILFHGLAANKKIMSFVARGFALQGLRVFVPDLPGHGRTQGPFSFERAEACGDSFVKQMIGRGAVDPKRTILAGHSMGGAIAVKVAARAPVAGVIAISPAPMVTTYGVQRSMLPFTDPPPAPARLLVLSESMAPSMLRDTARALLSGENSTSGKYEVIPRSTHVSLLFSPEAVAESQRWAAKALGIDASVKIPPRLPLVGGVAGLIGIFLLAGPFLREALGKNSLLSGAASSASGANASAGPSGAGATAAQARPYDAIAVRRQEISVQVIAEFVGVAIVAVLILRWWNPFGFVHLFEGDYLAGFLLIAGCGLLAAQYKRIATLWDFNWKHLLGAAFAALVVPLLIYAWLDLTLTEAWMTPARWLRFPAVLLLALPFHAAEELALGPAMRTRLSKTRLTYALALRALLWGVLLFGVVALHNGEILLALLAPYFAVFCLFQRTGMDVVRSNTGSALAAAIFGAILLAGFSVVVFPISYIARFVAGVAETGIATSM
jgi:pimeloyl-ACP methyl ester carboxylesterase